MIRRHLLVVSTVSALLVAGCAPLATETSTEAAASRDDADPSSAAASVEVSEVDLVDDAAELAREAAAVASRAAADAREELARTLADDQATQLSADVDAAIEAEAERVAAAEEAAREAAEEEAAREAAEEEAARKAAEEAKREAEEEQERVEGVQTVLKELGYYTGRIDGDAGAGTKSAIKAFQSVNGLTSDGVAGDATQKVLDSDDAKPKPPPEPEPDDDADTDVPDDRVLTVSDAKSVLRDQKYFGGEANGDRTEQFRSALMAFQKVQGIGVDGSLGPQTSAALRNPRAPSLKGGESNRIEIDLSRQVIHVVKDGARIRTMPTSSGNGAEYATSSGGTANARTPVGDFRIQRRISGLREADLGTLYDPLYFYKGWAIHGSNSVPAYPASHGCTRVTRTDIVWLADQMPNGTQVRIYGGEHTFIPTG